MNSNNIKTKHLFLSGLLLFSSCLNPISLNTPPVSSSEIEIKENSNNNDYFEGKDINLISGFDDYPPYNQGLQESVNLERTNAFFDFDSNQIINSSDADIYFSVGCGTECSNFFIALNRSKFYAITNLENTKALDYYYCFNKIKNSPINYTMFGSVSSGYYACILTNEGKIALMVVTKNEMTGSNANVIFDYILWYQD